MLPAMHPPSPPPPPLARPAPTWPSGPLEGRPATPPIPRPRGAPRPRSSLLLLGGALALVGCGGTESALPPAAAVGGASVALIGRTPVDVAVSAVSGRDCSIVRLDRGQPYCAPPAPTPAEAAASAAAPVCTRSLGAVDCWTVPPWATPPHRPVADVPAAPAGASAPDPLSRLLLPPR